MKNYPVTNKYNLPDEVCRAIMKDRYTAEEDEEFDFSASTLVAPVQQTVLKHRHKDSLVVRDVTDYFGPSLVPLPIRYWKKHGRKPSTLLLKKGSTLQLKERF